MVNVRPSQRPSAGHTAAPAAWLIFGLVSLSRVPAAGAEAATPALASEAHQAATQAAFWVKLERSVAVPGGLTAEQVARLAARESWSVRAKQEQVRSLQANLDESVIAFLPRLQLAASATRLSSIRQDPLGPANLVGSTAPPGSPPLTSPLAIVPAPTVPSYQHQYLLQASLVVPLTDYVFRFFSQHASAAAFRDGAVYAQRAAELATAADARLVYYRWALARLQSIVAEQAVEQARLHQRDVDEALSAGTTSRADALGVAAQLAASELFQRAAADNEQLLAEQLRTSMHDRSRGNYEIGEALFSGSIAADGLDLEAHYRAAVAQRPELHALLSQARARDQQASAKGAEYAPRVDLAGNYYYADPNPRYIPQRDRFDATWDVGLRVGWSPNDALLGSAQVAGLQAEAAQTLAEEHALRDLIRVEVTAAHQRAERAAWSIRSSEQALASAEETFRVESERFRSGRNTSNDLTEAELRLTQARLDAVSARIERRVAQVELRHATGLDATAPEQSGP